MDTPLTAPLPSWASDALLESEKRRLDEARREVEQNDPTRSFTDVIVSNNGTINLMFAYSVLGITLEQQANNRATPPMLVLLILLLVTWTIVNSAIKRWVVWMAVSNAVFADGVSRNLGSITEIITFVTIQYTLTLFMQQGRDGTLGSTERIVVSWIFKFIVDMMTAVIVQRNKLYAARQQTK